MNDALVEKHIVYFFATVCSEGRRLTSSFILFIWSFAVLEEISSEDFTRMALLVGVPSSKLAGVVKVGLGPGLMCRTVRKVVETVLSPLHSVIFPPLMATTSPALMTACEWSPRSSTSKVRPAFANITHAFGS